MRDLETDAMPRPTTEILDSVISGITSKMGMLSVAAYQETRNGRVEVGGQLSIELEKIRQSVNNLTELRGKL